MADDRGVDSVNSEEKKPFNKVENGEGEVQVKQPSGNSTGGCALSRPKCVIVGLLVILLLAFVALIAAVLGRTLGGCQGTGGPSTGVPDGRPTTPRPTVDPGQPWAGIRLPRAIIPSYYDIKLKIDLTHFNFSGSVRINVSVNEDTQYVILHTNALDYDKSRIHVKESKSGRELSISRHVLVPVNQFYVLILNDWLREGKHYTLHFEYYKGRLEDDLRGLYRSNYRDGNGKVRYLAASQLQSVDARKVFPCFDEPDLKANFSVSMIHQEGFTAISNMPRYKHTAVEKGWVQDDFEVTPQMSTYLLAFLVADFKHREKTRDGLTVRIWAQPDMSDQTTYALDFGTKAYKFFATYFDTPEVVPKADHAAIPDFSAGAMENWGLVFYRETALLHDEEVSSISNKYWVSLIMAHEIAHTWFGNMVTMKWWDDLWLNEGFANTLMYFALDSIYDTWKVFDLQLVHNVYPVMTKDSLLTSHAISTPIFHPDDITQFFDSISYDKGMAVLRLLRGFLGWDDFQKGLQTYIHRYRFRNAEMTDLWNTFEEAVGRRYKVGDIMDTWTRQMGFPVVTVTKGEGNTYNLEQERFLLNPDDKYDDNSSPYKYKWRIPFSYRTQGERDSKTTWMDMTSATITVPADEWVLGNVDYMGFYRTNYDVDMWQKLINQLKQDHLVFSPSNRAGLISDAFNLARANKLSYQIPLNLSSYLHKEEDFVPWRAFLDSIDFIKGMLSTSNSFGKLQKYIYDLVAPRYRKVGKSDQGDLLERNLRRAMLEAAAAVGVPDAIKWAESEFNNWKDYANKIPPDYAVVIYAVGIQQGGEEEWDHLWNKAQASRVASEAEIMMNALAYTQESWLLWRYARWSLDSSKIRMQDVRNHFRYFAATPHGRSVALQFLLTDWDEINRRFGMDAFLLRDVIYATTSLINTEYEYKQLEQLYRLRPPAGFASKAADNSLALVRSNINWMKFSHSVITTWLDRRVPAGTRE